VCSSDLFFLEGIFHSGVQPAPVFR